MIRWRPVDGVSLANDRIPVVDSDRQMRTAAAILERFDDQQGVVLADEVGMGKTFVALAVAVAAVEATKRERPVVVMVPPAVAHKWPSDWEVFRDRCLPAGSTLRATTEPVTRASHFLRLLDDPPEQRKHLIFLTHGSMRMALRDPFIKLAVLRQALFNRRRDDYRSARKVLPRWASQLIDDRWFDEERTERLLSAHPTEWLSLCEDRPSLDDDPVPQFLFDAIERIDLDPVREVLLDLPIRSSRNMPQRISTVRERLKAAITPLWSEIIGALELDLPLLVLDEAHHVKNPNRLASLFFDRDETSSGVEGALAGAFDRMLFLTATPFQLGHHELINVIRRFGAVRQTSGERATFEARLETLTSALGRSQEDAARLDRTWGRLTPDLLEGLGSGWWSSPLSELPEPVRPIARSAQAAAASFGDAQTELARWVVRHRRDNKREVLGGAGVLPGHDAAAPAPGSYPPGIEVDGDSALPFLLAARAESLVSLLSLRGNAASRAIFSEGLASSYDAFRHRATDDLDAEPDEEVPGEFTWYLDQIARFIPVDDPRLLDTHPKIDATVQRVLELWRRGEKVLVFSFYRATGRALRRAISAALDNELTQRAEQAGTTLNELQRRAGTQLDASSPAARLVNEQVRSIGDARCLAPNDRDELAETVLRFLRTPAFQVRFLGLDVDLRDGIAAAFARSDPMGTDLVDRIEAFAERVADLVDHERLELWTDLKGIQTGDIRGRSTSRGQADDWSTTSAIVRLANGETAQETRQRLMRTFNTPFFPEVLVASSVMAEGVDLHRDCRHVIHHDLAWNPSVLEQRTGRVDRVGSKAQRTGDPVVVYEPYLAGTQDERLYRVVKDRQRWFDVVMGGSAPVLQWEIDKMSQRVPLPEDLAAALTFQLEANRSGPE